MNRKKATTADKPRLPPHRPPGSGLGWGRVPGGMGHSLRQVLPIWGEAQLQRRHIGESGRRLSCCWSQASECINSDCKRFGLKGARGWDTLIQPC